MSALSFDQSRPLDLISMGRVAVDLYAEQIGAELKDAQTFRKYLGGCAGNIAVGSARLGLKVSMLSMVGTDALGDFVVETLASEGVDISSLQRTDQYLTGLVVLGICPPDHFPLIFFRNDCADLFVDKNLVQESFIASAKALLVTGTAFSHAHSADTTSHVMSMAKKLKTKIILDIDYRPVLWGLTSKGDGEQRFKLSDRVSKALQKVLPQCDLIVGTEEEISIAGGKTSVEESIEAIRLLSKAPIVLKKGLHGCAIYFDGASSQNFEAYPVPVLNVLGAGDAFMSGLLSSLLVGKEVKEAAQRSNACGALVVSRHGCAPAMPSLSEVEFFQQHYEPSAAVLKHPHLEKLHHAVVIKNNYRQAPLPILAFCHRWQLEETCPQFNQPLSKINEFKTALGHGLVLAKNRSGIKNPTLLTDPDYGREAILKAKDHGISVIAPIEKSGGHLTQWLEPLSAYEILLKRPHAWGVKLLWHYHPKLPHSERDFQMERLSELFQAATKLERRLMLELIVPKDYDASDENLVEIIKQVYQAHITPYWWKVPAFSSKQHWQELGALIDEFDADARVVILGGESKSIEEYTSAFAIAKSSHHGIGFAVGRSIFWASWLKFLQKEYSLVDVAEQTAQRYEAFYQLWLKA